MVTSGRIVPRSPSAADARGCARMNADNADNADAATGSPAKPGCKSDDPLRQALRGPDEARVDRYAQARARRDLQQAFHAEQR